MLHDGVTPAIYGELNQAFPYLMKNKPTKKTAAMLMHVPLTFEFPHASSVIACGTFNDWNDAGIAFDRGVDGTWFVDLKLAPGRYEYRLIVDGEWIDVPGVAETIENPFGSRNAVLVVAERCGQKAGGTREPDTDLRP